MAIEKISPKYIMKLVKQINEAIWKEYSTYKDVLAYIEKWHVVQDEWNNYWENFNIKTKSSGDIDLAPTLHGIDDETLLKIAVDIGVETPDFIPGIATFRNEIKTDYRTATATFESAFKQIDTSPDLAIGLANSALESIIKEILKDERIPLNNKASDTLYDLASSLLKEFKIFPQSDLPSEIKTIGSSILSATKAIEEIRSKKTSFHGKTDEDYQITDTLYTYFIINSVTTVGLFLKSFYNKKYPKLAIEQEQADDNLPF